MRNHCNLTTTLIAWDGKVLGAIHQYQPRRYAHTSRRSVPVRLRGHDEQDRYSTRGRHHD